MDLYKEIMYLIRTEEISNAFDLINSELKDDDDLEYILDIFKEILNDVDRFIASNKQDVAHDILARSIDFLSYKGLKLDLRIALHKQAITYREDKNYLKALETLEEERKLINSDYVFEVLDTIENEVEYVRNKLALNEVDKEVTKIAEHALALIDDDNMPIDYLAYASLMVGRCYEKTGNPEAKNLYLEAMNCYFQVADKDIKNLLKELKEERAR